MEVIWMYLLFAVTTAIVANLEVVYPVMKELEDAQPYHNMVEYKWISYFIFFLINLMAAPLVLLFCLVPSFGERARKSMLNELRKA